MAGFFHFLRRHQPAILHVCWFCGICLGVWLAMAMKTGLPALVIPVITHPVTLWTAVWSAACPILLTSFAVRFGRGGVFPVCFFHGLHIGFAWFAISLVYGQCGWLVALLALFSDLVLVPILYFLWFRLLSGDGLLNGLFGLLFTLSLFIGLFQFHIISPFLSGLF